MLPTTREDLHSRFAQPGQRYRVQLMELAARQEVGDFAYRDNVSADCSDIIGLPKELFPTSLSASQIVVFATAIGRNRDIASIFE